MRGEEKANFLSLLDKQVIASVKAGAWSEIGGQLEELRAAIAESAPSRADQNWNPPAHLPELSASLPEKRLAWAIAEGHPSEGYYAELPSSLGLLGDKGRAVDLARWDGQELGFFDFRVTGSGEDICKGLRQLIVSTALYRAFLDEPRKFGYNTEKSPLSLDEPAIIWELVGPKDMINPRRQELRWGDKDTQELQKLMRSLGVRSFSLSRLQAEAEALRSNIAKDNFTGSRARQWFENRVAVVIA